MTSRVLRYPRFASAAVCALALAACGSPSVETPAAPTATPASAEADSVKALRAQRVDDLVTINEALFRYRAANGKFPVSDGMQGYASNWGASLGANWLVGLDLPSLPRDPMLAEAGDGPQYLYWSDGVDYKLVAHMTGDCGPDVQARGVVIDPKRQDATSCWGYGFWTADAAPK